MLGRRGKEWDWSRDELRGWGQELSPVSHSEQGSQSLGLLGTKVWLGWRQLGARLPP